MKKLIVRGFLALSCVMMAHQAWAAEATTLVAKAISKTTSLHTTVERQPNEPGSRDVRKYDRSVHKTAVAAMSNGQIFSISFWGVLSRSYADILRDWQEGDQIEITYIGGIKAPVNPYKIKNVTRGEEVWADKLEGLK